MIGAYAVAKFLNGGVQWIYMPLADLNKRREESKSKNRSDSPWKEWPEEMYKKVPIRALHKMIPTTPEMSLAKALDDKLDTGEPQNGLTETEYEIVDENGNGEEAPPEPQSKSDQVLAKIEKKNGKKKPESPAEPPPEPENKPDRDALEAKLLNLIADNEDIIKEKLGADSHVFGYGKLVKGWKTDGIQDAIGEVKKIIAEDEGGEQQGLDV
jgi:hypothetical protein